MYRRNKSVDVRRLEQMERLQRTRVRAAPEDMDARCRLAWCLFLRAVFQAGKESAPKPLSPPKWPAVAESFDRAGALLSEALRQAATVAWLGPGDPREEAAQIQKMARLMGAGSVVGAADRQAALVLARLVREAGFGADGGGRPIPPQGHQTDGKYARGIPIFVAGRGHRPRRRRV